MTACLPMVGVAITLFPLCPITRTLHTRVFAAVLRGRAPAAGQWSLPGGKVEWGEGLLAAAAREAREELGVALLPLHARGLPPAFAATDALHLPGHHYAIAHVCAAVQLVGGALPALAAGDDAAGAAWVLGAGGLWAGAALARLEDLQVAGNVAGVVEAARGHLRQHAAALEGGPYSIV